MTINFPNSPATGTVYNYGDYRYTFDGTKWTSVVKYGSSAVKIQSATAPAAPEPGLQWFDDESGRTYFWHVNEGSEQGQWVEDAPQGIVEGEEVSEAFVTATGSNTPRTVGDRFSDVVSVKDFGIEPNNNVDRTVEFLNAVASGKVIHIPEDVEFRIDPTGGMDWTTCPGINGYGKIHVDNGADILVGDNFFLDGIHIESGGAGDVSGFNLVGNPDPDASEDDMPENVKITNCTFRNNYPEGLATNYLVINAVSIKNLTVSSNTVTRGGFWFANIKGCVVDGNNIDVDNAGTAVRDLDAGSDGVKFTGGTFGTISNNVINNAGRDGIDIFHAGYYTAITGNVITNFYTEGIEIKTADSVVGGNDYCRYVTISGNIIANGGKDSSSEHAGIWITDNTTGAILPPREISVSGNTISKIGAEGRAGSLYSGIKIDGGKNVVIDGNIVTEIRSDSGYDCYGISCVRAENTIISDNVVNATDRGINIGSLSGGSITNNKVYDDSITGVSVDIGISLSASIEGVQVEGNEIKSRGLAFGTTGIATLTDCSFVNNHFVNDSGIVWRVHSIWGCVISNNIFTNGDAAFDVVYMGNTAGTPNYFTFTGNVVSNGVAGLYMRGTGATITGNRFTNVTGGVEGSAGASETDYNIITSNVVDGGSITLGDVGSNTITVNNILLP
ncbi:hypothetical protein VPHD148_0055 [Vibrio phage D148]